MRRAIGLCRASGALATLAALSRKQCACEDLRAQDLRAQQKLAFTRRDPRTGFEMRLGDPQGMNHGPLRIFCGNAHPQLAEDIAAKMGIPLGKATVGRFPCGEVNVVLNESVRDCDVFIIQPTCNGGAGPQEHLVELLIMLDAIRRGAANRVTAIIPLYGFARQNAKEKSRSPISARLVTDLLQVAGAHRVVTIELHASQIQGFATFPIDNIYALPMLAKEVERLMRKRGLTAEDIVVVSPDVGGTKRASGMAKMLCSPLAIFSRQRRRPNEPAEVDLVGEVQGKTCIVVDDIADTADTLCQAADKLKARGASAVVGAVVHGILSDPACELIMKSQLEAVFVTDTIPLGDKLHRCPKLEVVSVASLLANAILRIHSSQSLSELFDRHVE
ncbi:prsA [Symbiodinium natans]|uniref:ribose-phosphate diphosphokinase n=1 Tax=Symbiodinium natans TaxID=878477 RepID=A0A812UTL7_9DINO|nr:prsA [Symbiodinium natans]